MIYKFIKLVIGFAIKQFFSSIKLRGAAAIEDGSVLFVANHPNQAMDSLLVGCALKRDLWFLAKAALFNNPALKQFFTACHMLPVQRRSDNPGGATDNQDTFKSAVSKLGEGKAIVIFPEGTSIGERRMLPIKTGTARIAFQAEEAFNFKLGLRIQAVGITYSELNEFRSSVTLTFAEPILVSDFKSNYESDAIEAVKQLTAKIETNMHSVTVGLSDQSHNDLVEKIAAIYRSSSESLDDKQLMLAVAENVELLRDTDKVKSLDIESRINDYVDLAAVFAVDGTVQLDKELDEVNNFLISPLMTLAFFINFIPYKLVGRLADKVSTEPVYIATNKFAYGMLIFVSWYVFLSILVSFAIGGFFGFVLSLMLCLFLGYLINNYQSRFKIFLLSRLWPGKKKPVELLRLMRDHLIEELNALRVK